MDRPTVLRLVVAAALTFVSSLTVGNAPYLFFGYGLSAFGMLVTGLTLPPVQAVVVLLVASGAAMSLTAFTHSAFTLVVVGAVLVRTLQVYVLSRFRQRVGAVAASAVAIILGTAAAVLLGFAFYGGDALATTATWFDAIFILPAYLLARSMGERRPGAGFLGASALALAFALFLSAGPFLIPAATLAAAALLAGAGYMVLRGASKRSSAALLVLVLLAMPLTLSSNAAALSYNVRGAFYPLYPDSISSSQWTQTNSSSACMQGDVAGAGTVQNGVWSPQRLRVLNTCVTVSGVVEGLSSNSGPANDNDFGIDLRLDPQYGGLLTVANVVLEGGLMHAEVVPSQQGALAGVLSQLRPGDRITITGALVLDTDHGYGAEIHPVWAIAVLP